MSNISDLDIENGKAWAKWLRNNKDSVGARFAVVAAEIMETLVARLEGRSSEVCEFCDKVVVKEEKK